MSTLIVVGVLVFLIWIAVLIRKEAREWPQRYAELVAEHESRVRLLKDLGLTVSVEDLKQGTPAIKCLITHSHGYFGENWVCWDDSPDFEMESEFLLNGQLIEEDLDQATMSLLKERLGCPHFHTGSTGPCYDD